MLFMDWLKSVLDLTRPDKDLRRRVLVTETLYHSYEGSHIVVVVSTG